MNRSELILDVILEAQLRMQTKIEHPETVPPEERQHLEPKERAFRDYYFGRFEYRGAIPHWPHF